MAGLMDSLARYARPILLSVAALLALGALLTITGMVLFGWTIYALGHLGLLVALPALVAVYRRRMDTLSWITLAILAVGVVLGVPVALMVWGHYAQNPAVHDALMPLAITPLGLWAGLITWIGLGVFGLATYRAYALPRGGSVLLVVAALIAIPAELGAFIVFAWGIAIVIAALALVWVAPEAEPERKIVVSRST